MKTIVVMATLVAAALAIPADSYNPKYDNFDVDELIQNDRLLNTWLNCFLAKGPCTSEGSEFKKLIPEAVSTACAKCTPKQRVLVRKVIHAFKEKLPESYEELVLKQDPTGKYKISFNEFLQGTD